MLVLILTVCSLAHPDRCDEARMQFADMSLMACIRQGQAVAAAYIDDHPGLRVARLRCAYADREDQRI